MAPVLYCSKNVPSTLSSWRLGSRTPPSCDSQKSHQVCLKVGSIRLHVLDLLDQRLFARHDSEGSLAKTERVLAQWRKKLPDKQEDHKRSIPNTDKSQ